MDLLISLFAENAWPLVWLIALLDLILAIAMYSSGRGRLLVPMIGLAMLAVCLLGLEAIIVTDCERVDLAVDAMARAVQHEDEDGLAEHISPGCRYAGMGRDAIVQMATSLFRTHHIEQVRLNGRRTQVARLRNEITAEFVAVARVRRDGNDVSPYPSRWVLTFRQSGGDEWQVDAIEQLPIVGDSREPIPPPGKIGLP